MCRVTLSTSIRLGIVGVMCMCLAVDPALGAITVTITSPESDGQTFRIARIRVSRPTTDWTAGSLTIQAPTLETFKFRAISGFEGSPAESEGNVVTWPLLTGVNPQVAEFEVEAVKSDEMQTPPPQPRMARAPQATQEPLRRFRPCRCQTRCSIRADTAQGRSIRRPRSRSCRLASSALSLGVSVAMRHTLGACSRTL